MLETKPTISFVVTALNEEASIEPTVQQILIAAEGRFLDYEILLVNDGSTDATGMMMEELAAENSKIRVLHNQHNLGLGGAYKRGLMVAKLDYIIWVPGDNETTSEGLIQVLSQIGKADIVIPYVVNPEYRFWLRRLVSWGFTSLLNFRFRLRVPYYNGIVVHRTELLKKYSPPTNGYAYQAAALIEILKQGYSWVAVGTINAPRQSGKSKTVKLQNIISVFKTLVYLLVKGKKSRKLQGGDSQAKKSLIY